MKMRIVRIDEPVGDAWDKLVASSPHGTIFHSTVWMNAAPNSFDFWAIYSGDTLVGGFAAPYRRILGKKALTPFYLSPYTGSVLRNGKGRAVKRKSFESRATNLIAQLLKREYQWGVLKLHYSHTDVRPFIWQGFQVSVNYTYTVDVSDLAQVEKRFHKGLRAAIRLAQKKGFEVVADGTASIETVLGLVEKTYAHQGLKFRKKVIKNYISDLVEHDRCGAFVCFDHRRRPIAGQFVAWDEKRAYGFLAGIDRDSGIAGGNSLCEYEIMKYLSNHLGLKEYDMCTGMLPSVQEFYRKYGGVLTPCYQIKWGRGLDTMLRMRGMVDQLFYARGSIKL